MIDAVELEGLESTFPPVGYIADPSVTTWMEIQNSITNTAIRISGDDWKIRELAEEAGLNPDDFVDDFQVRAAIVYYPISTGVDGEYSQTHVALRREWVITPKKTP